MITELPPYRPVGGLNKEDPAILIGENEVQDAQNFLFERGVAQLRPGVATKSPVTTDSIFYGRSFDFTSSFKTVVLTTGNKVFSLNGSFAATELTGITPAFATAYGSMEVVNGVVLIGNNTAGLIRWDPVGTTITATAGAPYRYITGHLSRAVAAYKLGGADTLLDPRTVAWSEAGDETNWNVATFGVGTNVLADVSDEITGIGMARNVVVVARSTGFHLGQPTGKSEPAFNWSLHSKNAVGVVHPETFCVYGTLCFFVSRHDVHTFDLVGIEPIGRPIRGELLGYLANGIAYRGFISESYGIHVRAAYHLVPVATTTTLPHFVYDLEERKWSRHVYGLGLRGGWYQLLAAKNSAPVLSLFDSASLRLWDEDVVCDTAGSIDGRIITIGSLTDDYKILRVLFCYKAPAAVTVTIKLYVDQSGTEKTQEETRTLTGNSKWRREWFDIQVTGNLLWAKVSVGSGSQIEVREITADITTGGETRR